MNEQEQRQQAWAKLMIGWTFSDGSKVVAVSKFGKSGAGVWFKLDRGDDRYLQFPEHLRTPKGPTTQEQPMQGKSEEEQEYQDRKADPWEAVFNIIDTAIEEFVGMDPYGGFVTLVTLAAEKAFKTDADDNFTGIIGGSEGHTIAQAVGALKELDPHLNTEKIDKLYRAWADLDE